MLSVPMLDGPMLDGPMLDGPMLNVPMLNVVAQTWSVSSTTCPIRREHHGYDLVRARVQI